jgi:hypothetical protein
MMNKMKDEIKEEMNAKIDSNTNLAAQEIIRHEKRNQSHNSFQEMESKVEHQEAPEEDAILKQVKGQKKRHRGRKRATGQCREPKEVIRGDHGSRRKLAAACRMVSRHATVAWPEIKVFRKILTHGNCGPRKEVTAVRMKVTHYTGHRRKGQNNDVTPRSPKIQKEENRCWKGPECKMGVRNPTTKGIKAWGSGQRSYLGSEGTHKKTL